MTCIGLLVALFTTRRTLRGPNCTRMKCCFLPLTLLNLTLSAGLYEMNGEAGGRLQIGLSVRVPPLATACTRCSVRMFSLVTVANTMLRLMNMLNLLALVFVIPPILWAISCVFVRLAAVSVVRFMAELVTAEFMIVVACRCPGNGAEFPGPRLRLAVPLVRQCWVS